MKNKLFNKMVAITLAFCISLIPFQPIFAFEINPSTISTSKDISILKEHNLISKDFGHIISAKNNINGKKEYSIMYGDVLNKVSILVCIYLQI